MPAAFSDKKLVAVTIDLDWACDEILAPTLNLLNEFGVRATLFCTHLPGLDLAGHELGAHPVFDGSDYRTALEKSCAIVPGAKGIRSHSLVASSRHYPEYERLGLQYESNYMLYKIVQRPFLMMNDIWQFPVFLMDDIHIAMSHNDDRRFDIAEILPKTGWELITFDFHPIHIFLNTCDLSTYAAAREFYREPDRLRRYINTGKGTATLFEHLLRLIRKEDNVETITLGGWLKSYG